MLSSAASRITECNITTSPTSSETGVTKHQRIYDTTYKPVIRNVWAAEHPRTDSIRHKYMILWRSTNCSLWISLICLAPYFSFGLPISLIRLHWENLTLPLHHRKKTAPQATYNVWAQTLELTLHDKCESYHALFLLHVIRPNINEKNILKESQYA